jgi:hypothetical protein
MHRMQMDASFTIAGRTLTIVALTLLLSACVKSNVINVTCQPGSGPEENDGTGFSCGGSNKMAVSAGTPVPANAIPINPTSGTIPAGATCSAGSYKCKAATLGVGCGLTPATTKCKDTYNMQNLQPPPTSSVCDCQCRP